MNFDSKWILCWRPVERPRLRVFCLPFAGGGASSYRHWADWAPADVEICAVQLPGRETRFGEPLSTDLGQLAADIDRELAPLFESAPVVLFGHSMGALLAFALAHESRCRGGAGPLRLCVSARSAPQWPRTSLLSQLPKADLLSKLRSMSEIPEVWDAAWAQALLLPKLMADLTMCDTYQPGQKPRLECPIHAYGGCDDDLVSVAGLNAWGVQTANAFQLRLFSGGHFYLHQHARELVQDVICPIADSGRQSRVLSVLAE